MAMTRVHGTSELPTALGLTLDREVLERGSA
jgi:hypothetical protein